MADFPAPRPFYRSRLFWLGMPGLLFLSWAWWKSNVVRLEREVGAGWLWSSQGKICWHEVKDPSGAWAVTVNYREGSLSVLPQESLVIACGFGMTRFFIQTPVMLEERYWFPPPRWEAVQLDASSSYRLIALPYWLSTGSYLGLWLGGLMGWQRRKVRLAKVSAARLP